jgi:hypothetical protein
MANMTDKPALPPHHYPVLARSRGKRQLPKAPEKAQDGTGLPGRAIGQAEPESHATGASKTPEAP